MSVMRGYRLILIGFLAIILAACGGDSAPDASPTPEPTITPTERPTATPMPTALPRPQTAAVSVREQSYLRLVQASAGLPAVDVYVDGLAIGFNIRFGDVTEPIAIVAGGYTLRIMEAGTSPNQGATPIYTQTLDLPASTTVSMVISGGQNDLRVGVLPENTSPLAGDSSRVTLIHALHNGGTLHLQHHGEAITTGVEINQATIPVDLPTREAMIDITDASGRSIAQYADALPPRTALTLIVVGDATQENSIRILDFSSRVSGIARLRAFNLVTDALQVDVYLDGERLISGADYGRTTDRIDILPESYRVDILPANADYSDEAILLRTDVNFADDQSTTLILTGTVENGVGLIRLRDDLTPTSPQEARLTLVHGWQGVGSVQASLSGVPSDSLSYRDISRSIPLNPGTYNIAWQALNDRGLDIALAEGLELEAGFHYIYILTPYFEGEPPFILIEPVGVTETTDMGESTPTPEAVVQTSPVRTDTITQVHVVNVLTSRESFNILIDDEVVVPDAGYGQLSEGMIFTEGTRRIRGQLLNTTTDFVQTDFDFRPSTHYTVYIAGEDVNTARIFVIENGLINRITDDNFVTIRLINASLIGDSQFHLAIIASSEALDQAPQDAARDANLPPFRHAVAGGYTLLSRSIGSGQAGFTEFIPPETMNIIIIDAENGYGAAIENDIPLQIGYRYEVVVTEAMSGEVTLLIMEYSGE